MNWLSLIRNSWNKTIEQILSFKEAIAPDWVESKDEVIQGAVRLSQEWEKIGIRIPNCVYSLPDGNIMMEWKVGSKTLRLEIESLNTAQMMISSPNTETEFHDFTF